MQDAQVATLIVVLGISLAIFLVCREIVCWYFKINELNSKLDTTNKTLADIRDLLAHSAAASTAPGPVGSPALPTALKGISPAKPTGAP
jgi:hypothetical protein